MILGMNVLEFTIVGWLTVVGAVWCCDNAPEIYKEQKTKREAEKEKNDPELTMQMPVGSFDPDTTMKLPRIPLDEIQGVFVMSKCSETPVRHRGRHAKV